MPAGPIEDAPAAPTGPSPGVRRAVKSAVIAGTLAAAIGLDHPPASTGIAVAIVVVALGVIKAIGADRRTASVIAGSALGVAPWLAIRSSAWLLVPDAIAAAVLLAVGLSMHRGAGLGDSAAGFRERLRHGGVGLMAAPVVAVRGAQSIVGTERRTAARVVLLPASIGIALAVVIGVTLASGDALFASFFGLGDVIPEMVDRTAAFGLVVVLIIAAGGVALNAASRPSRPARIWTSARSATVVLIPMCVVYVAYVVSQCSTLLLGGDYVRNRTGLTYAEYARSGFFQLVAVGTFSFALLTVVRPILRSSSTAERGRLRWLAVLMSACTLAMVLAAIIKLDLYADVFGLTMLRLYTTVFAVWLGIALMIAILALFRLDREWVVLAVASTALIGVFGMNLVNPERVVAEHNLHETIDSDEFDIGYLVSLSDDAVPTIVAEIDNLSESDRAVAIARLCEQPRPTRSGLDWNWSRSRAVTLLEQVCH